MSSLLGGTRQWWWSTTAWWGSNLDSSAPEPSRNPGAALQRLAGVRVGPKVLSSSGASDSGLLVPWSPRRCPVSVSVLIVVVVGGLVVTPVPPTSRRSSFRMCLGSRCAARDAALVCLAVCAVALPLRFCVARPSALPLSSCSIHDFPRLFRCDEEADCALLYPFVVRLFFFFSRPSTGVFPTTVVAASRRASRSLSPLRARCRLRSQCGCGGAPLPSSARCLGATFMSPPGGTARFRFLVKAHLGSQLSDRWANSDSITWTPICRVYVRVH